MITTIQTPRLTIDRLAPGDREALAYLLQNEEIKKTYMIPDFRDTEELDRMLARFFALSASPEHLMRGIYREGHLIGFVNDVELRDACIELGYVIHPEHWGNGYATEMLRVVTDALWDRGFARVRAGAFAENPASLRVMEKCGMRRCAETEVISYRGADHTCIYYECSRPEPPVLRRAYSEEADAVYDLYQSVIGSEFCVWNEAYPGREEIAADLSSDGLWVLADREELLGAISVVPERELDSFSCWTPVAGRHCEIARVVVSPDAQGRGFSGEMLRSLLPILAAEGCQAVHLAVSVTNLPAVSVYRRFGFSRVGEAELWGGQYALMEFLL